MPKKKLINSMETCTIISTTDNKYIGMNITISNNIDLGDFIFSYEKKQEFEDIIRLSTSSYVIDLRKDDV